MPSVCLFLSAYAAGRGMWSASRRMPRAKTLAGMHARRMCTPGKSGCQWRRAPLASCAARRRFGAPAFLGGILMLWGGVTLLFAFMRTAAQFYALRFLLGVAESGARPLRGAPHLLAGAALPDQSLQQVTLDLQLARRCFRASGLLTGACSGACTDSLSGVGPGAYPGEPSQRCLQASGGNAPRPGVARLLWCGWRGCARAHLRRVPHVSTAVCLHRLCLAPAPPGRHRHAPASVHRLVPSICRAAARLPRAVLPRAAAQRCMRSQAARKGGANLTEYTTPESKQRRRHMVSSGAGLRRPQAGPGAHTDGKPCITPYC